MQTDDFYKQLISILKGDSEITYVTNLRAGTKANKAIYRIGSEDYISGESCYAHKEDLVEAYKRCEDANKDKDHKYYFG